MAGWNAGFSGGPLAIVSRFGIRHAGKALRRSCGRDEMSIAGEFQNEIGGAPFNIFCGAL
jgi:hypothetical protein